MTDVTRWLLLTTDNEVRETGPAPGVTPKSLISNLRTKHVYNHLVSYGVWMFYNIYEDGFEEDVNACATVLWNFKDPNATTHVVHGPVLFVGSITSASLSDADFARIVLLARLAQSETEKLERVEY